eukprot:SM001935S04837  [mRNA]  locus=s1935:69:1076:+ [translate_table: standard]
MAATSPMDDECARREVLSTLQQCSLRLRIAMREVLGAQSLASSDGRGNQLPEVDYSHLMDQLRDAERAVRKGLDILQKGQPCKSSPSLQPAETYARDTGIYGSSNSRHSCLTNADNQQEAERLEQPQSATLLDDRAQVQAQGGATFVEHPPRATTSSKERRLLRRMLMLHSLEVSNRRLLQKLASEQAAREADDLMQVQLAIEELQADLQIEMASPDV